MKPRILCKAASTLLKVLRDLVYRIPVALSRLRMVAAHFFM